MSWREDENAETLYNTALNDNSHRSLAGVGSSDSLPNTSHVAVMISMFYSDYCQRPGTPKHTGNGATSIHLPTGAAWNRRANPLELSPGRAKLTVAEEISRKNIPS